MAAGAGSCATTPNGEQLVCQRQRPDPGRPPLQPLRRDHRRADQEGQDLLFRQRRRADRHQSRRRSTAGVPSAAMRKGDFSEICPAGFNSAGMCDDPQRTAVGSLHRASTIRRLGVPVRTGYIPYQQHGHLYQPGQPEAERHRHATRRRTRQPDGPRCAQADAVLPDART